MSKYLLYLNSVLLTGTFIVGFLACNGGPMPGQGDFNIDKATKCPLPPALPGDAARKKVYDFGASVEGIQGSIGGELKAKIESELNAKYENASTTNKIYALTFAACLRCKIVEQDKLGCAKLFDDILNAMVVDESAADTLNALQYRQDLLGTSQ